MKKWEMIQGVEMWVTLISPFHLAYVYLIVTQGPINIYNYDVSGKIL
jgi:hypothetical protein